MRRCLVSLGANIGDPLATIRQATDELRTQLGSSLIKFRASRMFRTPPVGGPSGQPPFVNAVVALEADIDAWNLWAVVRRVEHRLGRQRNLRWEARKIDLDILLCGDQKIWTPHLKVPHPRMCMRRFILVPAADVASNWRDPVSEKSIGELAKSLQAGRGNLILVSRDASSAVSLLEEAARLSLAKRRYPEDLNANVESLAASQASSRWVACLTPEQLASSVTAEAKLLVVLAEPPPSIDIAWEDYHRQLAGELNLLPGQKGSFLWDGPRYLLTAEDRQWAVHELVAALEAMDCPVEPIAVSEE